MSNKTSDKNVANIEIVIKDCREHLKIYGEAFITASELDRIENVLAELEQKDKKIQELEGENYLQKIVIFEKYIPKQVVIDKIEEIEIIKQITSKAKYTHLELLQFAINNLEELLEK